MAMTGRPAVRGQRQAQRAVAAMALGLMAFSWLLPSAFLLPPTAGQQQVASRRGMLAAVSAAAAAALQLETEAPARAEGKAKSVPEKIEVSGVFGSRAKANGGWSIVPGKEINNRAVYKRDGEEFYLTFNDCDQFQLADSITGKCEGFASETKGKWSVEGKEAPQLKVRPVKAQPVSSSPSAPKPTATESKDDLTLGFVKLPQVGFTGKESDEDLLWGSASNGINVGNYIRAKGGEDFLANVMQMDDTESQIASSLEAKLGDIKFIPGGR